MKSCKVICYVIIVLLNPMVTTALHSQSLHDKCNDLLNVSNSSIPYDMVNRYLQVLVDSAWKRWITGYEQRKTPETFQQHQDSLYQYFIKAIGGFPVRTPLNPRTTGILQGDGFSIEKVIFESQPDHDVTGNLYLPDRNRFIPPYPGVLIPCGHYRASKAHDEYQSMGVLCALNGLAALVYDPIDQGERIQFLEPVGGTVYWGTRAHTMAGICAILLGWNIARFEIWDGIRAIDYLQSRPEIDQDRIGCTGNSGGGTQTAYLTVLDSRIQAAAISCYIHRIGLQTKKSMGDAEQNIFGQLSFGLDHPDYLMMRAPVPIKLLAATHDFFDIGAVWEIFRLAKRYYTRLGFSEKLDILENDAGHNYNKIQRESAVRWLSRWLLNRDEPIVEPELHLFSEDELNCTDNGEVMRIRGVRSTYDIMLDRAKYLEARRRKLWQRENPSQILKRIRKRIGIEEINNIPCKVTVVENVERDGYHHQKLLICPEKGIWIPSVVITRNSNDPITLFFHEDGKEAGMGPGGEIQKLLDAGYGVLAADIRGIGETRQMNQADMGRAFGYDWKDVYTAYLLGKSFVGMRTLDILACLKTAKNLTSSGIQLLAVGHVGVPALHAAALESEHFDSVRLIRCLTSWTDVIEKGKTFNQLVNAVHGALEDYDLPDLVKLLGDKLSIENPLDARGYPIDNNGKKEPIQNGSSLLPGLAGIWYGSENLVDPRDSDPVKTLNLKWDDPSQRGRGWSAEWFGTLISPTDEKLLFYIESSHGGYLKISDRKMTEWETGEYGCSVEIQLNRDEMVPIHIVYNHNGGETGYFRLFWKWPGKNRHIVGPSYLQHSQKEDQKMRRVW